MQKSPEEEKLTSYALNKAFKLFDPVSASDKLACVGQYNTNMSISCFDKDGDGKITREEFWENSKQVFDDLAFEEALRQEDPLAEYKGITPATQPDLSWITSKSQDLTPEFP